MSKVHEILEEAGIDRERLQKVLDYNDNWGKLVHAFEPLAVMGAVLVTWGKPDEKTPRIEAGTKVVLPDGQVRTIATTAYDLDDAPSPSPIGLKITFTERWVPNV